MSSLKYYSVPSRTKSSSCLHFFTFTQNILSTLIYRIIIVQVLMETGASYHGDLEKAQAFDGDS